MTVPLAWRLLGATGCFVDVVILYVLVANVCTMVESGTKYGTCGASTTSC